MMMGLIFMRVGAGRMLGGWGCWFGFEARGCAV